MTVKETAMSNPVASYAAGLRALADLIEQNPDLHVDLRFAADTVLVPVSHANDPRARMVGWVRAAKAAGMPIRKSYGQTWGEVHITPAPGLTVQVYAAREAVCDRIVVGTREITRELPDPEALAAVPTITVTETVEDVRWECLPLLADAVA